jgi:hypothetical protein
MNPHNGSGRVFGYRRFGGCSANASDRREVRDEVLRTAFATVTRPNLVEVTVD